MNQPQFLRATTYPGNHERLVNTLVALLLTLTLIYTVGYPRSLTWDLQRYFTFGQIHSLVFAGNALLVLLTLRWMGRQPSMPLRFRVSGAMLVVAHAFTVLTAVMLVPAYTDTHSVAHAGMVTYVIILLLGNFSLMATVPWWTWPQLQLLRLIADTLLVMSVIDLALTVALPALVSSWVWTPAITAAVFRLETSLGLAFWYTTVYRRFGGFRHRAVVPWAVGIGCMLGTDLALLWGTFQMEHGQTDLLLGAGMPFWMVHQTMWSLGLAYVLDEVPVWRNQPRTAPYRGPLLAWILSFRQGLALSVIAVVTYSAGSLRAAIWFVAALVVSQFVVTFKEGSERAKLEQAYRDLRHSNEQLQAAQDRLATLNTALTEANAQLSELGNEQALTLKQRQLRAAEVAHDIGNLLQDAKLNMALVSRRLQTRGQPLPPDIQALLDEADERIAAVDGLLVAMVAAARLDAGALELKLAPIDLVPLLHLVARTLSTQSTNQRVAVTVTVPADLDPVIGDASLLTRALGNIVGNAIKFTGEAQPAGVGQVSICVDSAGERVRVVVRDNGPGINAADLERLGRPFVRGALHPNAPAGFGLGLALARGVIELHPGGSLTITSALGEGTTVIMELQAAGGDDALIEREV